MVFKKVGNNIEAMFKDGVLTFKIFSPRIEVDDKFYYAAYPTNRLDLYPSGEEDVIIFLGNEEDEILGFEEDIDTVNKVMEKVMYIC